MKRITAALCAVLTLITVCIPAFAASSTADLSDANLPTGVLQCGAYYPFSGTLTAKNPITKVTAAVTGKGKTFLSAEDTPAANTYSYTMRDSKLDRELTFDALPEGDFTFTLTVTEKPGGASAVKTERTSRFSIGMGKEAGAVTAVGVDVSHHQGTIDWDTAAKHIDFAIIRCGYGDDLAKQDDREWETNVAACERLEIPYGVYIYSYAVTDAEVKSEISHVLRLLKGHKPVLPVFLDLEDPGTVQTLDNKTLAAHAKTFCDAIRKAGYEAGIYSGYNWWTQKLTEPSLSDYEKWVAFWGVGSSRIEGTRMWQFTCKGQIEGIEGYVDRNYWYGDFPGKVQPKEPPKPIKPPKPEKQCAYGENCPGAAFSDMPSPGHWAHDSLDRMLDLGLLCGVGGAKLDPDGTMTRAMLVTVLWRMAESPTAGECSFDDVGVNAWYYPAVCWAAENGIVSGISHDTFAPDDPITREQLAAILYRYAERQDTARADLSAFPDWKNVGDWAREAVSWAVEKGILCGTVRDGVRYLDPTDGATRAEAACMLLRY